MSSTDRRPGPAAGHEPATGPRPGSERPRLVAAMLVVGVLVGLGCAAGMPVRATYGAQTTADEPQYLLSAISLAEDGDLDIGDELAAGRWRAFHEADLPEQTRPLAGGRRLSPHNPLLAVLLAIPVALGGWAGAKLALAGLAGLLAAVLVWTAAHRFGVPVGVAVLVTLVCCLSPPWPCTAPRCTRSCRPPSPWPWPWPRSPGRSVPAGARWPARPSSPCPGWG